MKCLVCGLRGASWPVPFPPTGEMPPGTVEPLCWPCMQWAYGRWWAWVGGRLKGL